MMLSGMMIAEVGNSYKIKFKMNLAVSKGSDANFEHKCVYSSGPYFMCKLKSTGNLVGSPNYQRPLVLQW